MKYQVKYMQIAWTTSGKRTTHSNVVEAESKSEAIKKILVKTTGKAFNIRIEEVE